MNHMTQDVDEFLNSLMHYGVKGMRWGTRRAAKRDANESARAKLFYGEGAGTRRKLIKAKVESRAAKDVDYKRAFDHYMSQQDLGKRASQATAERRRKDTVKTVGKTARGVHRQLTGGFGAVSLASAVIAGAYTYAHSTGFDKMIIDKAQAAFNDQRVRKTGADWLRDNGFN